jgi:putative lipoprotein
MKAIIIAVLVLGTILITCGCVSPIGTDTTITGTVTTAGGEAFPAGSILEVQLVDATLEDTEAVKIGEEIITDPGEVPVEFSIPYNPEVIVAENTYTIQARVTDTADNLLYVTTTSYPVITGGNPDDDIEVVVDAAG